MTMMRTAEMLNFMEQVRFVEKVMGVTLKRLAEAGFHYAQDAFVIPADRLEEAARICDETLREITMEEHEEGAGVMGVYPPANTAELPPTDDENN